MYVYTIPCRSYLCSCSIDITPLIQGCRQIGCSFLVFTASHGLFRLGTTLSQGERGFWVTLSKSNVFLWTFLSKYSESQLFLSFVGTKLVNLGEESNTL